MKLRSRVSLIGLSFLFALGTGVAVAAASPYCLQSCGLDQSDCLSGSVGSAKAACVAQYKACKKACGA